MGGSYLVGGGGVEFWRVEAQRLAAEEAPLRARVADLEGQVGALAENRRIRHPARPLRPRHGVAQIETRVGVHAFLGQVRDLLKSGEYRPWINGAALDLGQVNGTTQLTRLCGLWVEQGNIDALLRKPFRGKPTSLLQATSSSSSSSMSR